MFLPARTVETLQHDNISFGIGGFEEVLMLRENQQLSTTESFLKLRHVGHNASTTSGTCS